jgi:hypothetical protein
MQALSAESDRWVESGPISSTHRVSRPWRLVTALSSALLLLGLERTLALRWSTVDASDFANKSCSFYSYLILAVVFGGHNEQLHIDSTASLVFALFFIGISYIGSIAIAYFQRKRKLFLLRSLFMSVASTLSMSHSSDSLTSWLGPFW